MPKEVRRLADQFLREPVEVQVARPATTASNIEARLVKLAQDEKIAALERLFTAHGVDNAIIFCNRKRDVGTVTRKLQRKGYNARDIHGDLEQAHRQATLDAFKRGEVDYLVATDVAARGLDISDMPVVINLDVPSHADDYIHRIGRTGRAGRKGRAFTLATDDDARRLAKIEQLVGGAIAGFDPFGPPEGEAPVAKPRRHRAEIEQVETAAEAAATPELPAGNGAKPKRKRAPKRAPAEAAPAEAAERGEEAAREKSTERRSRRKREPEPATAEPVVGLGDHVPSFLLRPVPVRPASSDKGD
jgi:superfamily II DNA/RNA helicase